ncbi:probable amino acid permease 7 [Coffea eugenioides]|uniref:probable amino acid permease 7 n=1 Tax=Coffea eugenioides TaxID=49369 RepID=UPI000F605B24|nr:probable amino acid permease 7 [Coffea eugenioides]
MEHRRYRGFGLSYRIMGGGGEDGDVKASLLDSNFSSASAASCTESKGTSLVPAMKNGNVWTALAHIITGVIGSGVLSLAWSMSRLGWIAGPLTMLCFASVTFISASLLRNCYNSPDPEFGPNTNASFLDAVQRILGKMNGRICGVVVVINFIKVGIVYTITAAISIRAILKSNCYHNQGHEASCDYKTSTYMLLFGVIQILVSQIPEFRNMKWLSAVAVKLKNVPIANEFPDVFPEELETLPPERKIVFKIDVAPGTAPISKTPYKMAPAELK